MYCIILYQLITSNTLGTEFLLLKYFLYRFVHENVHICNQSQQPYILVIDDHSLSDYQATQLLLTRTQSFYLILCLQGCLSIKIQHKKKNVVPLRCKKENTYMVFKIESMLLNGTFSLPHYLSFCFIAVVSACNKFSIEIMPKQIDFVSIYAYLLFSQIYFPTKDIGNLSVQKNSFYLPYKDTNFMFMVTHGNGIIRYKSINQKESLFPTSVAKSIINRR